MVDEHGENWPRYIHERSPWRCDRQDNNHKTALLFSNFDQLKAHWKTDHGGNTPAAYERELGDLEADVYIIRPANYCPLCCLQIENTDSKAIVTQTVADQKWPLPKAAPKAMLSTSEEAEPSKKVKRVPDLEEAMPSKKVKWAPHLESERQEMSPMDLESQHDRGDGAKLQLTSTISRHVASHLQFLTFLTLRLFSGKVVEVEERHFDSSAETDASGERITLDDHVSETEDTIESSPRPLTTNSKDTGPLWPPPPVTDQADPIDWTDFNIIPRNLDINKNPAIEHIRKVQKLNTNMSIVVMADEDHHCGAETLEASQRILGSGYPDTLRAMNSLANSYGDWEAMELRETTLEASQRILGSEHPDTLESMNNLGNSYREVGRHREAMELREKTLATTQRILSSDHPDTLRAMNNLANSYDKLGYLQEAMELREKTLEARKRTLGSDHPDTLGAMNNLANSHSKLGRYREAMELRENTLETSKRALGSDHPGTLRAMNNLANSYGELGDHQVTMNLREATLEASQRTLGSNHPDTLGAMNNLANSYDDLGRHRGAMNLREKTLEARQRALGSDHPDTLGAMNNLANSYSRLGRYPEAIQLREKTLETSQRTLGSYHPDTLTALNNLELDYSKLEHHEAMEERNQTFDNYI